MKALVIACVLIATPVWGDTDVTGFVGADTGVFPCDNVNRQAWFLNSGPDKTIRLAQHNDSMSGTSAIQGANSSIRTASGTILDSVLVSSAAFEFFRNTAISFNPTVSWPNGTYLVISYHCGGTGAARTQVHIWVDTIGI